MTNYFSLDNYLLLYSVLPLIPITALVIQNSVTMHNLMGYQARVSAVRRQVRGAMEVALFIQNIQEERAEVALFIFTNQSTAATAAQREKNRFVTFMNNFYFKSKHDLCKDGNSGTIQTNRSSFGRCPNLAQCL